MLCLLMLLLLLLLLLQQADCAPALGPEGTSDLEHAWPHAPELVAATLAHPPLLFKFSQLKASYQGTCGVPSPDGEAPERSLAHG